jgi:hypothetical protein
MHYLCYAALALYLELSPVVIVKCQQRTTLEEITMFRLLGTIVFLLTLHSSAGSSSLLRSCVEAYYATFMVPWHPTQHLACCCSASIAADTAIRITHLLLLLLL